MRYQRPLDGRPRRAHHGAEKPVALYQRLGLRADRQPMQSSVGTKAFSAYLGDDEATRQEWDSCALMQASRAGDAIPTLIDQGDTDQFLGTQLQPAVLAEAARQKQWPLSLRIQPGYDHSYYFIATFIEDHLRFHAEHLFK